MNYKLRQFNQRMVRPGEEVVFKDVNGNTLKNFQYMIPVMNNGTPARRVKPPDFEVTDAIEAEQKLQFEDECLTWASQINSDGTVTSTSPLEPGKNYYFHAKIRRLKEDNQIFYIYLVNYNDDNTVDIQTTQFLKRIEVQCGDENDFPWADLEMTFQPMLKFDTILFQMVRTAQDYLEAPRYATIIYQELSEIANMLDTPATNYGSEAEDWKGILGAKAIVKLGIQSHPGFMFCLNGEEIMVGRTGTYELRRGIITTYFLGVIQAANFDLSKVDYNGEKVSLKEYLIRINEEVLNGDPKETIFSRQIFSEQIPRGIDAFTVDYVVADNMSTVTPAAVQGAENLVRV